MPKTSDQTLEQQYIRHDGIVYMVNRANVRTSISVNKTTLGPLIHPQSRVISLNSFIVFIMDFFCRGGLVTFLVELGSINEMTVVQLTFSIKLLFTDMVQC